MTHLKSLLGSPSFVVMAIPASLTQAARPLVPARRRGHIRHPDPGMNVCSAQMLKSMKAEAHDAGKSGHHEGWDSAGEFEIAEADLR
jgi:hypothetical protein